MWNLRHDFVKFCLLLYTSRIHNQNVWFTTKITIMLNDLLPSKIKHQFTFFEKIFEQCKPKLLFWQNCYLFFLFPVSMIAFFTLNFKLDYILQIRFAESLRFLSSAIRAQSCVLSNLTTGNQGIVHSLLCYLKYDCNDVLWQLPRDRWSEFPRRFQNFFLQIVRQNCCSRHRGQ